eukprot:14364971-Ditylum_brightwellii.AAC.1
MYMCPHFYFTWGHAVEHFNVNMWLGVIHYLFDHASTKECLGVYHLVWSLIVQAEQALIYFIGLLVAVEATMRQKWWDGCNLHHLHCFFPWDSAG